ncbi:MAG: dihydroorotase [Fimbriimonadaceae bacterium]|nr:dihydroorotase [Fimbriimonadaceae bacterium]
MDLLIRGGHLVTSAGVERADIGIAAGKIVAIGDLGGGAAAETLDATHLHVLPGAIDTQVHFREPGLEHKEDLESGTRAALHGGVTAILEMPNTNPNTTDAATLADKLHRAEGRAWCHYGFFVGATAENAAELGDLEQLPGTPGIKIFMGSSTGSLLVADDEALRSVLRHGRFRCPVHAEDEPRNRERKALLSANPHWREHPHLRDAESAMLATARLLALSQETGRPVHVLHISTADEPDMIAKAREMGVDVTCEVTPQHLYFSAEDAYERLGSFAQMNPPIRSADHRDGLWRALEAGKFTVFGSDHAPHTREEKALPYPQSPSGMPGVQTLLPVLLTFAAQGRLDLPTIARMLSDRPARMYGIAGKGRIEVGADADLAIVDAARSYRFDDRMVQSKCGWSPYSGDTLTGGVSHVVLGGRLALRDGERVGEPRGQALAFGPDRPSANALHASS